MKPYDLHTHTLYCDGNKTPEQMVKSAIEKGLSTIGITAHSYVDFEEEGFLHYEKIKDFQQEISTLKKKYADKIQVLCGIEQDCFSPEQAVTEGFDYVIGSVHYFYVDSKCYAVDLSEELFNKYVLELFGGDYYLAAENYFDNISKVVEKTGADVIGHFDLIKKYNANGKYFDENDSRYVSAYKKAIDKLILTGKPFEINVGAMKKYNHAEPYPSNSLVEYVKQKGGKFIYGSDAHSVEGIAYKFDEFSLMVERKIKEIQL